MICAIASVRTVELAVEIEPRFVVGTKRPNLDIRCLIDTAEVEEASFDLVHVICADAYSCARRHSPYDTGPEAWGWLLVEEPILQLLYLQVKMVQMPK